MADNSFKVKNSIVIQGIELDLSGATPNQALVFNGTKFAPVTYGPEVSDTAPSSPVNGTTWFNSSLGRLFSYYDGSWIEISGPIGPTGATGPDRLSVAESAPSSPNSGDLWFHSNQARLYSYYDNYWVEISGPIGPTGPTGPTGPDRLQVASTAPSSPNLGDLWFDSVQAKLFSYYDSYWVEISGEVGPTGPSPLQVSSTSPSSPNSGDLWFDSTEAKLYSYYDSYWVEISGEVGPTGPTGPSQLASVAETAPSSPLTGQLWYNTSNSTLNVYDGSSWNSI